MNWIRALASNSNQNGYATYPVSLLQKGMRGTDEMNDAPFVAVGGNPNGNSLGVIRLAANGLATYDLEILPFGAGAATNTCAVRLIGWRFCTDIWVPTMLCDLAVTLGAAVGLSTSSYVKNTDFFAKTITATTGLVILPTVTTDTQARAIVNCYGFDWVQIQTSTAGSATNVNALLCLQPTHRSEHKVS